MVAKPRTSGAMHAYAMAKAIVSMKQSIDPGSRYTCQ